MIDLNAFADKSRVLTDSCREADGRDERGFVDIERKKRAKWYPDYLRATDDEDFVLKQAFD